MAWFRKEKQKLVAQKRELAADVWEKCDGCGEILYTRRLAENQGVCPECGHHFRISAPEYVDVLFDEGLVEEFDPNMRSADPLGFVDSKPYPVRVTQAERKVGGYDAVLTGVGRIEGREVCAGVMDFGFIGGSMGSVVGEKFVRAANECLENEIPLVCFSASGGARMQESLFSLMQMAKTSAVLQKMSQRGIPFISVMTDPTMGGVSASLAMLGDINVGEPKALIGFAGPRVIEQTVRETLPEGFQRSEFLVEHGAIDMIIDRRDMRDKIASLLSMLLNKPAA